MLQRAKIAEAELGDVWHNIVFPGKYLRRDMVHDMDSIYAGRELAGHLPNCSTRLAGCRLQTSVG